MEELQRIADGFAAMTCIVSVETLPDGRYGTVRVVTGNRPYLDSIENPAPGAEMLTRQFVPNSAYTRYFSRDLNFEDACFRAAVEKRCVHSYVHPDRMDVWFNLTFLPLALDEGSVHYCTYTMELSFKPSTEHMSNISGELASAVLGTTLKLSGAADFRAAMGEVIRDLRRLCGAQYSCILLMHPEERRCAVLCEDLAEDAATPGGDFLESAEFYPIVESWEATIAGSNCLIIKDAQSMEVVRERNPVWHRSLVEAHIERIVLFPLRAGKELLGYIWATNFDAENAGTIKETLELTTFILGAEIANEQLLRKLKRVNATDLLTGLRNRNDMNRFISEHSGTEMPVGVLFADLNGLKSVNDRLGHDAGDRLILAAAAALRGAVRGGEIYRVGGDEFVVFLPGASETQLEETAEALRADFPEGVSFAVGAALETGGDFERALRNADKAMYADKRRYYLAHPALDRRGAERKPQ